jgi:hypothetical protein
MLHLLAAGLLLLPQQQLTIKPELTIAGRIYVADGQDNRIKLFDAKGKYVSSFGRPGRGPGEFQNASRVGVIHDTLWVGEHTGRATLFNIKTSRMIRIVEGPDRRGSTREVIFSPALGVIRTFDPFAHRSPTESPPLVFVRQSGTDQFDTLLTVQRRNSKLAVFANGAPVYGTGQPFSDDPIAAAAPSGRSIIVVRFPTPQSASSAAYTVERHDVLPASAPKSTELKVRRNVRYKAQPLTNAEVDRFMKAQSGHDRGPYFPKDGDAAIRKALYRPKWLRPIANVKVGRDGSVWLTHRSTGDQPVTFTILNADLTRRGSVTIPRDAGYLVDASKDHVWLARYDEMDVPFLIRARLIPSR